MTLTTYLVFSAKQLIVPMNFQLKTLSIVGGSDWLFSIELVHVKVVLTKHQYVYGHLFLYFLYFSNL